MTCSLRHIHRGLTLLSTQLMNYLTATGHKLGLLVNFGAYPKVEIRRIAV